MGTVLKPMPGYALVEVTGGKYKHIAAVTKAYEGKSNGILVAWSASIDTKSEDMKLYSELVGNRVYWEELREGAKVDMEDKSFVFIKLEEIQGFEDGESS